MRFFCHVLLVWLIIAACVVVGGLVCRVLPVREGGGMFSPWEEGAVACVLFGAAAVLRAVSQMRIAVLLTAVVLAELTIAMAVTVVIGELAFDSFYWHWLLAISRFVTPPFVAGFVFAAVFAGFWHDGRTSR